MNTIQKSLAMAFLAIASFFYAGAQDVQLIPYPEKVVKGKGDFIIKPQTVLVVPDASVSMLSALSPLNEKMAKAAGFQLKVAKQAPQSNFIQCSFDPALTKPGAYSINVLSDKVLVAAKDPSGVFYAVQSLLQLLPTAIESDRMVANQQWAMPVVFIQDAPAFEYRGLMIDVARHFQPITFLKKLVDLMAMQKMNRLHLHLVDDQGWRIEIKKYPKLTSAGGKRNGTLVDKYPGKGNDNMPYEGFYTQAQIKDLVAYASKKFITIIPEIELPGHSSAAIAAYPALSCFPDETTVVSDNMVALKTKQQLKTAGTKVVQETWGVFTDVLSPTDYTFQFMNDVLDEVMQIFPSKYIHIGGDECPKDAWKRSAFCQEMIKKYNLKDEHGLQSYFIQRIEKHINSKGRNIIGWDEILEGGLAPNAAVMSWRGTQGGIESAKQGHDVVMTPDSHCYLNFYQSEDQTDSIAWGGFLPLKRVYGYEPIPAELNAEHAKYIKGVQGNLWTEYIKSSALAEYMLFPRAVALAEVGWTKQKPGFVHFATRLISYLKRLQHHGVNYSRHMYDIGLKSQYDSQSNTVKVSVDGISAKKNLFYSVTTQQGEVLKKPYDQPLIITAAAKLEIAAMVEGEVVDKRTAFFNINKATGRKLSLSIDPAPQYGKGGPSALINGIMGSLTRFNDDEWLGWNGKDFEGILDLGRQEEISKVNLRFYKAPSSWIYMPSAINISVSADGVTYKGIVIKNNPDTGQMGVQAHVFSFEPIKTRYVKINAANNGIIKPGFPGQGYPAWLFVDEVVVE
jgi:hexosaminidase